MTHNIAKIRAALESALARATSGSRVAELRDAIVALAELEKAAAEPVAWMWDDEIGVPHASAGSKKPVWLESSASAEYIKQANLRPLYAAPPAPVAEIREVVVVTRPMCHGAWARFWSESNSGDSCDQAMRWLEAWRAELGPTLGLVELKEPTPEECERIDRLYAASDRTSHGRAMFNACRAVMWPKEGL